MSADEAGVPAGLIADKYRLTNLLGRGGMGAVYEGVHTSLGTRVAIKFIDSQYAYNEGLRQRFVNEARAAARLRSKHVVQVYDQGVMEDGRPYIVMEFLAGEPLDRRLDRMGRLEPRETAQILAHVSRALAKAHEVGIVHRDLKPENVFLVWDEEDHRDIAKVVDFGIAKFTETSADSSSGSTRTGAVLGTPHFMSPEQARGLRSVDYRSDLWSLGVIAYRCLVGRLPFQGEAIGDLLVNICTGDPPVPSRVAPDVPPGFDEWIRKALAREPEARFASASELAESLSVVCGASVVTASRPMQPSSGAVSAGQPSAGTGPGSGEVRAEPPHVTEIPLTHTLAGGGGRRSMVIGLLFAAAAAVGVTGFVLARSGNEAATTAASSAEIVTEPDQPAPEPKAVETAAAPEIVPVEEPAGAKEKTSSDGEDEIAEPRASAKPAETTPPAARRRVVPRRRVEPKAPKRAEPPKEPETAPPPARAEPPPKRAKPPRKPPQDLLGY